MTQEAQAVEFDQPLPRRSNQQYDWPKIAEDLIAHPMEWGKVFEEGKVSTVNALRQGSIRILSPELGFEIRTRNNVRGPIRTCQLWMRYNPEKDNAIKSIVLRSREN